MKSNRIIPASILLLLFSAATINGQDTPVENISDVIEKPAGEFAIGMDALPVINFAGNIFNSNGNNSLKLNTLTLNGKYYLKTNSALTMYVAVSDNVSRNSYFVRDDEAFFSDPLSEARVVDERTIHTSAYDLGVGYQRYVGSRRLKGFYGIIASCGYESMTNKLSYGNPITENNTRPSTVFGYESEDGRALFMDFGTEYRIQAGLQAGVEYFFTGELSLALNLSASGQYIIISSDEIQLERYDGTQVVVSTDTNSPGSRQFRFQTM
ncbi:MAG: hypothetical protein ACOYXB_12100, partial [Bacteroidota bacterium]